MSNEYETLMRCVRSVRTKTDFVPKVALVLGSGLGDYASQLRVEAAVDYHEIEGFPVSTVPGHTGRFVFGYVGDVSVVCMQGRVHYYEGYSMTEVVRPIRLMKLLGAEVLFLTNAAGGIQLGMKAGGSDASYRADCKFCSVAAHWRKYRGTGTAVSGYEPDL